MRVFCVQPICVLTASFAMAFGQLPAHADQVGEHAGVLPYVANDVVAVATIDLSRIDVKTVATKFVQIADLPEDSLREANQVAQKVELQAQAFKQLGAGRVYMLLRTSDIEHGGPSWVVPIVPGGDATRVVERLKHLLQTGPGPAGALLPSVFAPAERCVLAASNNRQLALLVASRRQPHAFRADAQTALNGLGRHAAGLVVIGNADSRRVIREMFPQLPPPFGELDGALIADGVQWGGIAFDFAPDWRIVAELEARDAGGADRIRQLLTHALKLGQATLAPQNVPAEHGRGLGHLRPQVEGTRVSLRLSDDADEVASILKDEVAAILRVARQRQRMDQFKQIALAMLNYQSRLVNKAYPPSAIVNDEGRPLLSWRVAILPYLGQIELFDQFRLDEPWDSEHNRRLIDQMPEVFADPDPRVRRAVGRERTTYVVPTGERTVFRGKEGMTIKEITDGTSKTILAVEVVPERAVIWTQPSDWEVDFNDPLLGVRRTDGRPSTYCRCDGSAHVIETSNDVVRWRNLLTPDGGEIISP